ncbi:MAG: hypothetical protein WBL62_06735 [Gallionella sp.]
MPNYKNSRGGEQRWNETGAGFITNQAVFRDDFPGVALNPAIWTSTVGVGHGIAVAGGALNISSGIAPNTETVVKSLVSFAVPNRVRFIARASQRIANTEMYLEVVDTTNDGQIARFLLDGTVATSVKCDALNAGISAGVTGVAKLTTASDAVFEIQLSEEEVCFADRPVDSVAARTSLLIRSRNVPDPVDRYAIQIRVKNLAIPPVSSTTLTIGAVVAQESNELLTRIAGGQGDISAAHSLSAYLTGGLVTISGFAAVANLATYWNDTVTPLIAAGTYTGTVRDLGISSTQNRKTFYASAFADQAGTLFIDMSNDNIAWRQAKKIACLAGDSVELSALICTRYYRVRWVNGATAQAAFMLNSGVQGF